MRLLVLYLFLFPLIANAGSRAFYSYVIEDGSWVSISGTTNINSFVCVSSQYRPRGFVLVEEENDRSGMHFQDARLELETRSFDCKNRIMNRDLFQALGGDKNPGIEISLLEAVAQGPCPASKKGVIYSQLAITVNGVTQKEEVRIRFEQKEGAVVYRFEGSKTLQMSDFGIDPPSPVLGLVRVQDAITIDFDLVVQASYISSID